MEKPSISEQKKINDLLKANEVLTEIVSNIQNKFGNQMTEAEIINNISSQLPKPKTIEAN